MDTGHTVLGIDQGKVITSLRSVSGVLTDLFFLSIIGLLLLRSRSTSPMKTKFVTVKPISSKAKNRFHNLMDSLHSCRVEQEDIEKMFLASISGRYHFWMKKENDPNWSTIK